MQNNIIDKEYNQFMEECWQIVEKNPEYNKLFTEIKSSSKFRQFRFMTDLFKHWKRNDIEWFLNHEVLKHGDK